MWAPPATSPAPPVLSRPPLQPRDPGGLGQLRRQGAALQGPACAAPHGQPWHPWHPWHPGNPALRKAPPALRRTKQWPAPVGPPSMQVDLFSLGVMAFELWHPFATAMERAVLLRDLREHGVMPVQFEADHQVVSGRPPACPSCGPRLLTRLADCPPAGGLHAAPACLLVVHVYSEHQKTELVGFLAPPPCRAGLPAHPLAHGTQPRGAAHRGGSAALRAAAAAGGVLGHVCCSHSCWSRAVGGRVAGSSTL